MKSIYSYGDQRIGAAELTVTVASMMMSVGILSLPRLLAMETLAFDGWMSIVLTGAAAMLFGFLAGKLVAQFPEQTFYEYSGRIVGQVLAKMLTLGLALAFFATVAFEIRSIASITKEYLFDKTPVEVIALVFLLVICYAVSGSRVGALRLNWLFLPPVLVVAVLVQVMNIPLFKAENLMPFFITPISGILRGAEDAVLAFVGFVVVLPYAHLVRDVKKIPKATVIGISIPLLVYLMIYLFAIAVFSNEGAQDILYPTVEIAKEIEVPGGFFERFESLFYTIWIMTIFNTSSMAFDLTVMQLSALFGKVKKTTWLFALMPLIYFLAMLPKNTFQVIAAGHIIGFLGLLYSAAVPLLLLLIAKLRKVEGNG